MRSWTKELIILALLVLCGALFAWGALTEDSYRTDQVAEWVYDHDCIEHVEPTMNYKVHIPLDDHGKPMWNLSYNSGAVTTRMRTGCMPRIVVKPRRSDGAN